MTKPSEVVRGAVAAAMYPKGDEADWSPGELENHWLEAIELWSRFCRGPAGGFLSKYLVGQDADWLEHALEEGLMTTDEALHTYNALGPHPSIEQLARLLVPRGVDARRIALFAEEGGWDGEDSARFEKLHRRFQELAESDEQAVAAVGRAGAGMFAAARDKALARERQKRIRGEL